MKKTSFLLIHGLGGSGPQHWQSWLYTQLEERKFDVHFPTFSDFDRPVKDIWLEELSVCLENIPPENEIIVLTHSLGSILWMHYAATPLKSKVRQVILVAPPSPVRTLSDAQTFFPVPLDEAQLVNAAESTWLVMSTDDPFCSIEESTLFLKLGLPAIAFPKSGHLNTASGHGEWPWILNTCLKKEFSFT
ncbi:RBBP9/YdeN family alpha/beta hydrolase [Brevibacillus ginsengisoli]|uniref:RBBP9/YdeN family alpha/beta hydrolase n=1 Tax=Brevibacillus ginsengisoli TaxID=363854 RepID=UPI003CF48C8F